MKRCISKYLTKAEVFIRGVKPTAWFVVLFIVLSFWGLSAAAKEHTVHLGLSYGAFNTGDLISQRIGYTYDDKWGVRYERHGGPDHAENNSYTAFRNILFRPGKSYQPFMQIGTTYYDNPLLNPDEHPQEPLVNERLTYNLGVGVRILEVLEVGLDHSSTAGRSDPNKGVDRVYLSYRLEI